MIVLYFILKPGPLYLILGLFLSILFSWGESTIGASIGSYFSWPSLISFPIIIALELIVALILYNLLINLSAHRLNRLEWKY